MGKKRWRGRQQQANPGWFKKGHDSRRHALTREEKSRGGTSAWLRYGLWAMWGGPPKKEGS